MTTVSPARPTIPGERYMTRIRRFQELVDGGELTAALIGVGPDLEYLTGYRAMPLERLTMLAVVAGRSPLLVVPRLEEPAARAGVRTPIDVATWMETESPHGLVADAVRLARPGGGGATTQVAVSDRLWAFHLRRLQAALPDAAWTSATDALRELRMIKDPDEIELLRQAGGAADRVVAQIAAGRLVGRTEADVADEVRERLRAEGHEIAQFAIVASGPNSASPHHHASERVIQAGEPIVFDIGGTLDAYCSDMTRTVWVTGGDPDKGPTEAFRTIHELVRRANADATAAVAPGAACEQLDEVARRVIREGGYGDAFIHRLGHGIGMDGHEDPYLVADSADSLSPGMAFSIEPGIYLQGRFGVRIEDIVVCGEAGPDVLNEAPRELLVVDG